MKRRILIVQWVVLLAGICGCIQEPDPSARATPVVAQATLADAIWQPAPRTTWQWQLSGEIDLNYDVDMYDIDLFDVPREVIDRLHAEGRIVICYFSAGSYEDWRPDAVDFPEEILGKALDGWPGERWLDIRRLDMLGPILLSRLDLAVEKKCDGVEPDNVDAYSNESGFALLPAEQLNFNRWLAVQAHARSLSIGLKNDLEQVDVLVADYDWALNEQCYEFNECDRLLPFLRAGKAVFGVEYSGDLAKFCPDANEAGFSWLLKNLDLDPWSEACWGD